MKKHYIRLAVVIDVLILVAFLLGMGFYMCVQADKLRSRYVDTTLIDLVPNPGAFAEETEAELVRETLSGIWYNESFGRMQSYYNPAYQNIGIYGKLTLSDGTVIDTTSDYFTIYSCKDDYHHIPTTYCRIGIFDQDYDFDEKMIRDFTYLTEFDAECDDVFINGGELNCDKNGVTYKLKDISFMNTARTTLSAAITSEEYPNFCILVADMSLTDKLASLNCEAKAVCDEKVSNKTDADSKFVDKQESIFTSYYIYEFPVECGDGVVTYTMATVFHPLRDSMEQNVKELALAFAVFLIVEVIISVAFFEMYRRRKINEMRSRRLTRGIAHELKTPLAVTKAYMENLEYLDEKKQAEYIKMINSELDDMDELIHALIKIEKIDSGSVKLDRKPVDIADLVKSVYGNIKPLADERKLKIEIKAVDDENNRASEVKAEDVGKYQIFADTQFMRIAISNYLTNMVKYADKKAKVLIHFNGEMNERIHISFENDSVNESKSKIDKLNNNGMGVEINENIMELHGYKYGTVMEDRYTQFWFEAPVYVQNRNQTFSNNSKTNEG